MNHCAKVPSITPSNGCLCDYAPKADHNGVREIARYGISKLPNLHMLHVQPNPLSLTLSQSNIALILLALSQLNGCLNLPFLVHGLW
jgi:hypothetical protein